MTSKGFATMLPAMVTPFAPSPRGSELDIKAARRLARSLADQGSDGLVLCGSTGEGPTILPAEREALVFEVADELSGAIPLVLNLGTNDTARTVEGLQAVKDWPIDVIMVVAPYYNKPPQEGLYGHFAACAANSPKPLIIYNIPSRTGVNIQAETLLRLAHDFPQIVAVKEASGDFDQIQAIIDGAPSGFKVLSGDDEAALEIIRRGGAGVISTIGNVAPTPMRALIDEALEGHYEQAESILNDLRPLMRGLFATTNPILVKAALALRGLGSMELRLPLINADASQIQTLAALMEKVNAPLITLE